MGGRQADSLPSSQLVAEFVEESVWVNLDIAGTSTSDQAPGYLVKGATGVPVRTLAQLAADLATSAAEKSKGKFTSK